MRYCCLTHSEHFSDTSWRERVTYLWDHDNICLILEQITLSWVFRVIDHGNNSSVVDMSFIVFELTWPTIEHMIRSSLHQWDGIVLLVPCIFLWIIFAVQNVKHSSFSMIIHSTFVIFLQHQHNLFMPSIYYIHLTSHRQLWLI